MFQRTDLACPPIRASVEAVVDTRLGTVVGDASGVRVSTVEHLMAVLCGLGVDNALIRLDGPEIPIMDGSAEPFVAIVDRAGRRAQGVMRPFLKLLRTVEVSNGDKTASLAPCDGFEMAVEICFPSQAIGRQTLELSLHEGSFRSELADARTFGFLHEVEALRAAGLARGGSLDNAVVIDGDTIVNPEGLRRPDEFVRHKMLDAFGDLALLGRPLLCRYEARFPGHELNNALGRALLADPAAWTMVDLLTPMARTG